MSAELKELNDLLTGDEPIEKALVETAIQALLFHQVIYDDTPGVPREAIGLIRRRSGFFERYFSAAGFRLLIDGREQMIALEVRERIHGWRQMRLKKDETLVRLALRLILEEGLKSGAMDDNGRVATDTDEIVDSFRTVGQADPPAEARLLDILTDLRRRGCVRLGERDRTERITPVTLLPGLRIHVPDAFVERVVLWIEQGRPGDVFDFMTDRRHQEDAAADATDRDTADGDTADGDTADGDTGEFDMALPGGRS